jgi:mRNA interferase MazF
VIGPGDVSLAQLPQADGGEKVRPVLILCLLPGRFGDLLVCGISSQIHQREPEWDDLVQEGDPDYADSGLRTAAIIRLSYLVALPADSIEGAIGRIAPDRLDRLRSRLGHHIAAATVR